MNNIPPHKNILKVAQKILDDKKAVRLYLKGKSSKKELNDRGIKLAMPL